MKRFFSIVIASVMITSLCSCGCDKKEDEGSNIVKRPGVVATVVPEHQTEGEVTSNPEATISPAGTVEPLVESTEITTVAADEVPTAESTEKFGETAVADGYTRYVGGDTKWGIILPPGAQVSDEGENSSLFEIGENVVTAVIVDRVIELTSVEEVKEYYSGFGEITIDDFTIIRNKGKYVGCFFEYLTDAGLRGFAKYVVNGKKTVSAAAVNRSMDAAQGDILREIVNSVVIFE